MASIFVSRYSSPIGRILAACRNERIVRIALPAEGDESFYKWLQHQFAQDTLESHEVSILEGLFRQLSEYFERRLQKFDLVLEFWGTDFQKHVWRALLNIPYGQVISYGELARRLERPPEASRAVGSANGANPLPIVVPCHRVVGHNGKLVGYGGGLETKAWLLRLEAQQELLPFGSGLSQEDQPDKADIREKLLLRSRTTD
jgi:O-6-methylguanine DNA methyltransferase